MKAYAFILVILLSALPISLLAETYEECLLDNLNGVNDRYVVSAVRKACKMKTTPEKCRYILDKPYEEFKSKDTKLRELSEEIEALFEGRVPFPPYPDQETISRKEAALQECIKECEGEGMYSRHFGECSTD